MLYFTRFQLIGIGLVVFLGVWFSLPNFMPETWRIQMPGFVPTRALNLGLDLRGGSHLLLEVDVEDAQREELTTLLGDVRAQFRQDDIAHTGLRRIADGVQVTVLQEAQYSAARRALQRLAQPVSFNIFAASGATSLEIESDDGLFTLRPSREARLARNSKMVQQSIEIVRRRIDELGTTEPSIQRQGTTRIVVQVPGLDDPERLKALLGQTAKLNFHDVDESQDVDAAIASGRAPIGTRLVYSDDGLYAYLIRARVVVSGERLVDASTGFEERSGAPEVYFRFDSRGGKQFGDYTKDNVGRPFAIVLDDKVISAPVIQSPILGGNGRITGNFTVETANDLAILLRAGALPAPMHILEERTVGPGLGADSVAAGERAALIGFAAVIVFMALCYNLFGLFATLALITNLVLILGVLSALQATLTLPGIAGIVLTIGMAVDANVLIFERIREEIEQGSDQLVNAISQGYRRAIGTILDANITTLIAAVILFQLGAGPVRGFAVTLAIGVVTSVFTAYVLTRLLIALWARRQTRIVELPL